MPARTDFLARIVAPSTTAVLTIELQNGIVGEGAVLPMLPDAVTASGILPVAGRVCAAARICGARVVHCTAEERPDGVGAFENCRIFSMSAKMRRALGTGPISIGSYGAQVVAEIDQQPTDVVVARLGGMSAFTPSALDHTLRSMGVTTVVIVGVSVNLGVFGAAMTALDLGYQVVVVRDAVTGIPAEYAAAVIDNSLANIATIVTAQELIDLWADK